MRSSSLVTFAVLFASCATVGKAQNTEAAHSTELEKIVSRAADSARAGAILDVQGCGISYRGANGIADRKTKLPMPIDEQLRIASIGKLYTAAIVHQLDDEGLVDLDTPATEYLIKGEIAEVPNGDATLRQMLNHSSGVPDYNDARSYLFWDWTKPLTSERIFTVARRRDATNAPGEEYSYSNTNYHILALVAQAVSGKSLKELIEAKIFHPLQLNNTRYNTEHPGGSIHGYGTLLRSNADTWKYAENTGPDSGITATTTDLHRYLSALFLSGGEMKQIGDAMRFSPIQTDTANQLAGPGAEIFVSRSGRQLIGHTGGTFGYLTFAFAIPEYDVTIIGHVNTSKTKILSQLLKSTANVVKEACSAKNQEDFVQN